MCEECGHPTERLDEAAEKDAETGDDPLDDALPLEEVEPEDI